MYGLMVATDCQWLFNVVYTLGKNWVSLGGKGFRLVGGGLKECCVTTS